MTISQTSVARAMFWAALTIALVGAALVAGPCLVAALPSPNVWRGAVRPLLIAVTMIALAVATAVSLTPADAPLPSSRRDAAPAEEQRTLRLELPALWVTVTLTLLALLNSA